jgi:hypothetical protein
VHCFVNPNEHPRSQTQGKLAACGGMGAIGYLLLVITVYALIVLFRWGRRLVYEIYYAFYPEMYSEEHAAVMKQSYFPNFVHEKINDKHIRSDSVDSEKDDDESE